MNSSIQNFRRHLKATRLKLAVEHALNAIDDDAVAAQQMADILEAETDLVANAFHHFFREALFFAALKQAMDEHHLCSIAGSPGKRTPSQVAVKCALDRQASPSTDDEMELVSRFTGTTPHTLDAWLQEQWRIAGVVTARWSPPTATRAPSPPVDRN